MDRMEGQPIYPENDRDLSFIIPLIERKSLQVRIDFVRRSNVVPLKGDSTATVL